MEETQEQMETQNIGVWYRKNNWKDFYLNEDPDAVPENCTREKPLDGVEYQKWDEAAGQWVEDPLAQEAARLTAEENALQVELDGKDYKVIKAAENGLVLAETDPALHARRDLCRSRINEIRDRKKILSS